MSALGYAQHTFLWLPTEDWVALGTLATTLLVVVGGLAIWFSLLAERKRTQPIVLAHAAGERRFAEAGEIDGIVLDAYLTNEGDGAAFNVRFGVEYRSVRFPWKFAKEDPETGSRQSVVGPGVRLPEGRSTVPIPIPYEKARLGPEADGYRIYWCRYENAFGQTWETRNPWQRGEHIDIRRIRCLSWRIWFEGRRRRHLYRGFHEGLAAELRELYGKAAVDEGERGANQ